MEERNTAEPDMSCPESMEEPELWAPMYVTGFVPKLGSTFFKDKKALVVPGLWGGLSVLILLIAFLALTLAPIDRRLIDKKLMTRAEIDWLDTYHRRVEKTLMDKVEKSTQGWLKRNCRAL